MMVIIIYSGNEIPGYGNLVLIKHSQNWITAYAHLGKVSIEKVIKLRKDKLLGLLEKLVMLENHNYILKLEKAKRRKPT